MPALSREDGTVSQDQVLEHLNRVLASPIFQRSPRQSAFLRFVVERVLSGKADQIKEYEIAVQVYGRPADHSNRVDPIVRVEASRLRSRLLEYYSSEGLHESLRVDLPKGAYVPEFIAASPVNPPSEISAAVPRVRALNWRLWIALIAATAVSAALLWGVFLRRTGSPFTTPDSKTPNSVAVLPFQPQGAGAADLAQPLTEALIAEMRQTNWPNRHVRTTVQTGDPSRQLQDAGSVFRGSLSLAGGTLRVAGSLEHLPSRTVLWNGEVERKLSDWPDRTLLLENLAVAVSSGMNVALMERKEQELAVAYPPRREARQLWLEGDELLRRGDADSTRRAIILLEKAASLDSNFDWNSASLARAYARALELGILPEDPYRKRAHEESARALKLGPYLAVAYANSVYVALALDWNVHAAYATCVSAANMLPAANSVRSECANVYSLVGHDGLAEALSTRSIRRMERKAVPTAEFAVIRFRGRRFDEAISLAEQALSFDAECGPARLVLAQSQMAAGHADSAMAALRNGSADRTGRVAALAATASALLGDRQAAQAELSKAEQQLLRPLRTDLIRPYLALGLQDRARALVEEATAQHNVSLFALAVDPQLAQLDRGGLLDSVRARLRN
jgi:hypothetical protein